MEDLGEGILQAKLRPAKVFHNPWPLVTEHDDRDEFHVSQSKVSFLLLTPEKCPVSPSDGTENPSSLSLSYRPAQ